MTTTSPIRVARVYLRVSTDDQDLARQEAIVAGGIRRRGGLPGESFGGATGPAGCRSPCPA